MKNYDFSQTLNVPIEKLTGIENQISSKGIKTLTEMAEYIDNFYNNKLFNFDNFNPIIT